MPNPANTPEPAPRVYSPLAALLSFLVPGLGQIYQGRIGKGLLFLICLYGMFFLGMYLGNWSNVYLPDETNLPQIILVSGRSQQNQKPLLPLSGVFAAVGHRPQFAGQFWIGIAAWPAIWQYKIHNNTWYELDDQSLRGLPKNIQDKFSELKDKKFSTKKEFLDRLRSALDPGDKEQVEPGEMEQIESKLLRSALRGTVFGTFQRTLEEWELNELQRNGDKQWDLAWVYTVIAGVLNVLVIYDAFAGPAFANASESEQASEEAKAA